MRAAIILFLTIAIAAAAGPGRAGNVLTAYVYDGEIRKPLSGALVTTDTDTIAFRTDSTGHVTGLISGSATEVRVRRSGYLPDSQAVGPLKAGPVSLRFGLYLDVPRFIAGRVTDAQSGLPLAGVSVSVSPAGREALSDSAGMFRVDSLPPMWLTVSFRLEGYHGAETEVRLRSGDSVRLAQVLFDTSQVGDFSGRVVGRQDGRPIAGAAVALQPIDSLTRSAVDGRFAISRVPPGEYQAWFAAPGYKPMSERLTITPGKFEPRDFPLPREDEDSFIGR